MYRHPLFEIFIRLILRIISDPLFEIYLKSPLIICMVQSLTKKMTN